ncbi:MAG: flavodoxin [Dysgonomonas sp.]|jgi:flavodoxin I|uniref:Flavodoxin n=1 Tax=Dysgonomonas termitidis TaxID=1516126 RepID=A0ABV9L0C6_9BACT|nr:MULTISPECIES: flavodoxin [unclassified Dysgonomonas]MDR1714639.1 flavodoxin [Prevotella sp.]MDR2003852.1 flavodoxin [Prevotella sp.]HMM03290.1 flavodoxin [Dysgonomonas sp.]
MSKIAIVYGSSTGATEAVAEKIQALFDDAALFNAESVSVDDLKPYDFLIFGASTTGVGDLQDDWEVLLPKVEKMDFTGKKVALFSLGDSASFSTSFAGAMYYIYKALKGKVEIVGSVSTDGYTFDDSDAVIDGRFVGLALDEDNEYNETDARLAAWVEDLKKYLD